MLNEEQLTDDQNRAIRFLRERKAAILWADVGVGKTASTLTALKTLLAGFDASKILVVGPRLVAERVWSAEVGNWAHLKGIRVKRIAGTAKQRLAALNGDPAEFDVWTISRDNVCWMESQFIKISGTDSKGTPTRAQFRKFPFDTVVLDESQSFKSQASKRFKSIRRLRRLFDRVYLLSGSLMPNGYKDLWSQLYLVDGGKRLGNTEAAYHKRWFRKEVFEGVVTYDLREGAAEEIDRIISDVCMVMRDAKQVQPHNFIRVTLDKAEQQTYSKMARSSVISFGDTNINAVNAGVLWGKLLQLANGAVYDKERNWHLLHDKKIEALVELMESLPRRVLIGYAFKHDLARIQTALAKAKVAKVGIIRTNESLNDWKAGRIEKGIIHPKSAGHGLNDLKDAEAIVWFGLTPNLEDFQQLNGRVIGGHRLQGRKIGIHIILTENTVDADAAGMIDSKDVTQSTAQLRVMQRFLKEAA